MSCYSIKVQSWGTTARCPKSILRHSATWRICLETGSTSSTVSSAFVYRLPCLASCSHCCFSKDFRFLCICICYCLAFVCCTLLLYLQQIINIDSRGATAAFFHLLLRMQRASLLFIWLCIVLMSFKGLNFCLHHEIGHPIDSCTCSQLTDFCCLQVH